MAFEEPLVHLVERGPVGHVGQVDGQVQHPVHRAAGALQGNFQSLQGAFALGGDVAQLKAAIGLHGNLGADQDAVVLGNVRGDRVGVRVGV